KHLTLLCGRSAAVAERLTEEFVDEEISIGEYVLTGGEIPAMALIDSVSRLVPDVLPSEDAYKNESHYNGLLEYPPTTRTYECMGREVPDILLSGHHAKIEEWRKEQSLKRTLKKRPDLLKKRD